MAGNHQECHKENVEYLRLEVSVEGWCAPAQLRLAPSCSTAAGPQPDPGPKYPLHSGWSRTLCTPFFSQFF